MSTKLTKIKTDNQRVKTARREYTKYKPGDPVRLKKKQDPIGYVSDVIDNKETGQQTYIVTDKLTSDPTKVKKVIVLFKGSTAPNDKNDKVNDWKKDWFDNDIPIALKIGEGGKGGATPQLTGSAEALNLALKKYPNAQFEIYAHSLGSMCGQYALANIKEKDLDRIDAAYLYQGPNIYTMLNKAQQAKVNKIRNRIFNYIDTKDLIPIGYRFGGEGAVQTVGNVFFVDSKNVHNIGDQHTWGGYQYDKYGNILLDGNKQKLWEGQAAVLIHDKMRALNKTRNRLTKSGGGLSGSEQIYLDSQAALVIASAVQKTIENAMNEVIEKCRKEIKKAERLWQQTLQSAREICSILSDNEILTTLAEAGATEANMVDRPTAYYEKQIAKAEKIKGIYSELSTQIQAGIDVQLKTDQALANQVG